MSYTTIQGPKEFSVEHKFLGNWAVLRTELEIEMQGFMQDASKDPVSSKKISSLYSPNHSS